MTAAISQINIAGVFARPRQKRDQVDRAILGAARECGFVIITKAQPTRPVVVITGDGEMLMGLGALATIAVRKPKNLTIAVLDNGHYGETGMQLSHSGLGVPLDRVASACGFDWVREIHDMAGIEALRQRATLRSGLAFAAIKVSAENPPRILPPRDGVFLKNRFRSALGFAPI